MAQFDVHRNGSGNTSFPYLLDVQADLLTRLATRLVVPMVAAKTHDRPIARINPIARLRGADYVLLFQEMAAVPSSMLGERVATLAPRRAELLAAIDWIVTEA